jgi:hypothetical protein
MEFLGGHGVAAGEPAIKYKTRTSHSEAIIVSSTGCDVAHFDQPLVGLLLSAGMHPNGPNNSYDRMYL